MCQRFICTINIVLVFFTVAQIKLADKQAALEKTQWQAMTANQKVEKLQEELDSMQGAFSSFMLLFEGLSKNNSIRHSEDYDTPFHEFDHLSYIVRS